MQSSMRSRSVRRPQSENDLLPQTAPQSPTRRKRRQLKLSKLRLAFRDIAHKHGKIIAFISIVIAASFLLSQNFVDKKEDALGRLPDSGTNVQLAASVILPTSAKASPFFTPKSIHIPRAPDYGNLSLRIHTEDGIDITRRIYRYLLGERGLSAEEGVKKSKKGYFDYIYAFDDDYERSPYQLWEDDKIKDEKSCRRVSWHRRNPMDCNSMHEIDLMSYIRDNRFKYVGGGAFRDVFVAGEKGSDDYFIFKTYHADSKYDFEDYEYMRIDSLVSEMFSSSPLYVKLYKSCALSAVAEAMPYGTVDQYALPLQKERGKLPLNDKSDVDPKNNMTISQKLTFAIEMAEAISLMHNYPGGVIVHDDVHLEQFLVTEDHQHIKMQDFNRAEIMLWDEDNQEYCRYLNGPGHGEWRSPEEYKDLPLNEKIDIWSLGTNMYAMLTGLLPFYDLDSSSELKKKVKKGETPYIDPRYRKRSLAEQKIVEAIEKCWEYNPEKRIDINGVIQILREAVNDPLGKAST